MKRPLSMTGYGRGEVAGPGGWIVELRSVNHKFFDPAIKMPRKYMGLEERIKKEVNAFYSRGHVDVYITPGPEAGSDLRLSSDLALARDYHRCLEEIRRELDLAEPVSLSLLLGCREIIVAREKEEDLETVWPKMAEALGLALTGAAAMRSCEGQALKAELGQRLAAFAATVAGIEKEIPAIVQRRSGKLKERLATLLQGVELDPVRLAQEMAVMADKADVTEELVRLNSHISQFSALLEADEPVGRRLDFLLQEFLREINTLASKISDAATAHQSVELKTEVEKLKEQVQNIE